MPISNILVSQNLIASYCFLGPSLFCESCARIWAESWHKSGSRNEEKKKAKEADEEDERRRRRRRRRGGGGGGIAREMWETIESIIETD